MGRLAGIWAANNDGIAFSYDDAGRLMEKWLLMEKWFPNGVNTQYSYNQDNTLKQLVNRHGSGSIISQHDYTYDPFGNRATHTEVITGLSTKAFSYTYDELNRLKEVRDNGALIESYSFSAIHNRLTRTAGVNTFNYPYDTANPNSDSRLTEIRNGSGTLLTGMVYDQNGNLVRKCEGGTVTVSPTTCSGSTVSDMVYDAFNRMTVLVKAGAGHTYAYDPQGRRVQKIVSGVVTNYVYDGTQIVNHYDSNWAQPNFRYTYGPGADAPTIQGSATSAQYYHQNGIGNVVAVTNASGVAAGTASYDAYGNVTASTGTLPTYGFTGREPDETAMIYFRARYYDPAIGRFIQRDPIGLLGGINVFAYAKNSPTNFNDPTGLFSPPMHQWIGTQGALAAGFDPEAAAARGLGSAGVDRGTQGTSPAMAAIHAMAGIDPLTGRPIFPEEAAAYVAQTLTNAINIGNFDTARHLVEDYAAKGHNGSEYTGFGALFTSRNGWSHIVNDWLPSTAAVNAAIDNSTQVSRLEMCGGRCSDAGLITARNPDGSRFNVDTATGQHRWDRADGSSYSGTVEIGSTATPTPATVITPSSQNFRGISPPG